MNNSSHKRRGMLIIISAPSGAGKTTIATALLQRDQHIQRSISATTRPPRPQEINGQDYFFLTQQDFITKLNNADFAEHAELFGNCYGTFKATIDTALDNGTDTLFVIDGQGTKQLMETYPDDILSIFILPPSFNDLKNRLIGRRTETDNIINTRLQKATSEISFWADYDYVVMNKDLDPTIEKVYDIIQVERQKRHRQSTLSNFVNILLEQGKAYAQAE